jgi:hypothetical protein
MQWVLVVLCPGVKWLGREADHSPPSGVEDEIKNEWNTFTSPTCLHGITRYRFLGFDY